MIPTILATAKTYAALVGSIVTVALVSIPANSELHIILSVVGVIATAIATYAVPNAKKVAK